MGSEGEGFISGASVLDEAAAWPLIDSLVQEGISRWRTAGIDDAQAAQLESVEIELRDLPSGRLAAVAADTITLDRDASNRGWFIDATPADDLEFGDIDPLHGDLTGTTDASLRHYDLLTVIMHEQGHILGLEHTFTPGDLMYGGLSAGGRKNPKSADLDDGFHHDDHDDHDDGPEFLDGSEPVIASVGMFAGTFAPRGWLLTDGQLLDISSNTALFSIVGTIYGGDGRTTLGLPDFRGRAVMGAGEGPGLVNRPLGQKEGAPSVTLTVGQIPAHTHEFTLPESKPVANNDNGPELQENGVGGSVDILANDTDPHGNPSAPVNGAGQFSVDLDQTTDGIQTSLADAQGTWELANATGLVTFTPAMDFDGRASIVYTLTDPQGNSDRATITFAVRAASGDIVVDLPDGGGTTEVLIDGTDIVVQRGDTEIRRVPIATTTRLTINGTDADDDTLQIDLDGGNPIPSGGLHFDGGVGGDDALVVFNGGEVDTEYETTGEQAGEIEIDGQIVTFENLEPLDFTGVITGDATITVDSLDVTGSEVITTISANGANTLISFDATSGLESFEYGVVNGTLTIQLDAMDIDVVNVEGLGTSFAGNLVINGDELDTINFTGAIDLGGRDLTVSGKHIDVFASVQSTDGVVSLTADDIELQNDINVGTGTVVLAPLTADTPIDLGAKVTGAASQVVWADSDLDHVVQADVDGLNSNVEVIVDETGSTPNLSVPRGIGVDSATGKVYFSDTTNDFIGRADLGALNGNVETLVDPVGFANDVIVAGGKLYWIDTNVGFDHIVRADLDGSDQEILIDGLDSPQGIAVDVAGGKVYWSDTQDDLIQRADINGDLASNNLSREDVVTGVIFPEGIALDLVNRKIYFVNDSTANVISRADMDGTNSNLEDVVTVLSGPTGIAVDPIGGKVYWSDANTGFDHISRADINGGVDSNVEEIVTGRGTPNHIDLVFADGNFTLTNAELNRITADSLTVGNLAAGDVTITAGIDPANVESLEIVSGGIIGDVNSTGTDIDVPELILNGDVSPGTSPGVLNVAGNITLADNNQLTIEVDGTSPDHGAGNHDQLNVTGNVSIGSGVALNLSGAHTPTPGEQFVVIENDGSIDAVAGTFDGLPEGAIVSDFLDSGLGAAITYVGGDGNDVVLTVVGTAVNLSVDASAGTETGTTIITVTATADSPVGGDQTVDLFVGGEGVSAGDYMLSNGTVTIQDGQSTGSVTFTVVDDGVVEAVEETATLTISNPSAGVSIGATDSQDIVITDNDSATITIQAFALALAESDSAQNTTQATLTFSPGATELGIPVTAQLPGNADYSSTVATFPVGAESGLMLPIAVEGIEDDLLEAAVEIFAAQAVFGDGGANINYVGAQDVQVADADKLTITLSGPDPVEISEGGPSVALTVSLSFNQLGTQTTLPITAQLAGNADYTSTEVTIPVGSEGGVHTIEIGAVDDVEFEPTETFSDQALTGNGGDNVTYVGSRTVVVTDNDTPPADLVATAFDADIDHVIDGTTTATFTIENQGNSSSVSFETHIVWSPNDVIGDGDDVVVPGTTEMFTGLADGASETRSTIVVLDRAMLLTAAEAADPAGGPVGTESLDLSNLFLVVDSGDSVAEISESNNSGQGLGIDVDDITYFPWDIDGSGVITPREALGAISAINTPNATYDFDNNGLVTSLDALAVLQRIGYEINGDAINDSPPAVDLLAGPAPVTSQLVDDEDDGGLFAVTEESDPASALALGNDDSGPAAVFSNDVEWLDVI